MPEAAPTQTADDPTPGEDRAEPIEITEAAADRLADEFTSTEGDVAGLRLLVQPGDCGLRYGLAFARDGAQEHEVTVTSNGIHVYLDEDAIPFVEGSTVDFKQSLFGEGFAIENPNEVEGDCGPGCGCR